MGCFRARHGFGRWLRRALAAVQWRGGAACSGDGDNHRVLPPRHQRHGADRRPDPRRVGDPPVPARPPGAAVFVGVIGTDHRGGAAGRGPGAAGLCGEERFGRTSRVSLPAPDEHTVAVGSAGCRGVVCEKAGRRMARCPAHGVDCAGRGAAGQPDRRDRRAGRYHLAGRLSSRGHARRVCGISAGAATAAAGPSCGGIGGRVLPARDGVPDPQGPL